jgi:hypothetical protein
MLDRRQRAGYFGIVGDLKTVGTKEEQPMSTLRVGAAAAGLFGSVLLLPATTEAQNLLMPSIPTVANRAVPALLPATSSLQRSGTINVTINATIGSNIPSSQGVGCEVEIFTPSDPSFFNEGFVTGVVTRKGTSGTCKISVPYTFEVTSTKTILQVFVGIFTSNTSGSVFYEATHSFSLPIPSGTTNLTISLAI